MYEIVLVDVSQLGKLVKSDALLKMFVYVAAHDSTLAAVVLGELLTGKGHPSPP